LIGFGRWKQEKIAMAKDEGYGRKTTIHQANRKAWKNTFLFLVTAALKSGL